jgi:diguanylate cyclase (GGDEF)-like protein/PAS domain S-box-containing protein
VKGYCHAVQDRSCRADDIEVERWASSAYVACAGAWVVASLLLGQGSMLFVTLGVSSVVAIVIGIELHRPAFPGPWRLFAGGIAMYVAGAMVASEYAARFDSPLPFPGVDDLFRLAAYACVAIGLLQLVRHRSPGRDWPAFIDSLIVAVGVGTLSWVVLMSPHFRDVRGGALANLVSVTYPAMGLILLTIAVALRLNDGNRTFPHALTLILTAVALLLAWDAVTAWSRLYSPRLIEESVPGLGWIVFCAMWGAAALHGSMRTLTEPSETPSEDFASWRLVVLSGAALLPATLQAVQIATGQIHDTHVIVGATFVLFGLVIARMVGLANMQARSAARELALREAAASLSTATNRPSIHEAAMEAVRTLVGPHAQIQICTQIGDSGRGTVIVATGGSPDVTGTEVTLAPTSTPPDHVPDTDRSTRSARPDAATGGSRVISTPTGSVFVAPLTKRREGENEFLLVSTRHELSERSVASLSALAAQVTLALESATLTERLLLERSEARFAALVRNSTDLVTVIDPETNVRWASPSTIGFLGYEPADLERTALTSMIHPEDILQVLSTVAVVAAGRSAGDLIEFRLRHRDGRYVHVESLATDLTNEPGIEGIVLNSRDVTERRGYEEELTRRAFLDTVTGLPNRALFRDRVRHALARASRESTPIAVLFMDLDDFKTINDSLGHAAGDKVLRGVGDRLRGVVREMDTAARFGGDEFAVLLEEVNGPQAALDVAERLREVLVAPLVVEGTEVFLRASIGVAVSCGAGESEDTLLRDADVAMYVAKEDGKGRCRLFEPSMQDVSFHRLALKGDLQRAVERAEFELHYQPIVDLIDGRIVAAEALLRWDHPQQGLLPPTYFIPLAEETGLIVPIGAWALGEACLRAAELQRTCPQSPPLRVAVNLSARQLQSSAILDEVREALDEAGLDASSLTIEITETVMMADMELSVAKLRSLKELGVVLAIDDFGTGYSSLNYLRRFPVDVLKIDKSFIDGLIEGGEAAALTAAVIDLARILGLRTVAEGVRRADQAMRLRELGCDLAQGELFSMPIPPEAFASILAERDAMWADAEAMVADEIVLGGGGAGAAPGR